MIRYKKKKGAKWQVLAGFEKDNRIMAKHGKGYAHAGGVLSRIVPQGYTRIPPNQINRS